ncbi:MAG: translocation/assembly module TamB domain-containing protein [bacterium]
MRKLLIVPIVLVLLIIIVFILSGTPFVLHFVKKKIESTIQSKTGIPTSIGSLQGNLLYRAKIYNLKIKDAAEIKSLSVSYNILGLLSKKIELNSVFIDGIIVDVDKARQLAQNLKFREGKPAKDKKTPFHFIVKRLEISNADIAGVINRKRLTMFLNLRGSLANQVFIIEDFYVRTKDSYISIKGNVPLSENNLFALTYSLYLIPEEFAIEGLSGIIQSKGSINGEYQNPEISNHTDIKVNYQKNHISGYIKLKWKVPFLDSLDINAKIVTETEFRTRYEITLKKVFTNLFVGIVSPYGNLRIPGSITGSFENPKFKGEIQGNLKYAHMKPELSGEILYQDSILSIRHLKLKDKEILVKFAGRINVVKSEILAGNLNVNCADLNLINKFLKQPVPVLGLLNISAEIKGTLDNPNISGRLTIENAHIYSETISNADFEFTFKNNIIYLEKGLIKSPRGEISIAGNYGIKDNSFMVNIFTENIKFQSPEVFGIDTVLLNGNLKMDINLSGRAKNINGSGKIHLLNFSYDRWTFENYILSFDIKDNCAGVTLSDIKNNLNLKASVELTEPYPFNIHLSLNHFEFAQFAELEKASITGNITAKGEITKPDMTEANIQIDSIYVVAQKYAIHNSEPINIEIKNGLAYIHKAIITLENHNISIQGQIPLDKRYGETDLKIQADHIEIGSLYAIFSKGQQPEGFFDADVEIRGNLNAPEINGQLSLEKVGYALPDLAIKSISGLIKFQRYYFNIEYINGQVNKGEFNINGYLQLNKTGIDTIAINILLNKIDYNNKEFGSILLSSSMQFSANSRSYAVIGGLTIDRAVYDKPFDLLTISKLLTTANRPAEEKNKILKQIYCDISISTPNGIEIINNIASVNVDADVQVRGFLSRINVYGTVKSSSPGTIKYLGRKFDITNALIQLDNPYQINPVLNLEAIHSISTRDGDYEITMNLSGTIEKWYLKLSSNPPVPEQDIVSLLLVGRRRPDTHILSEVRDINLTGMAKEYAINLARGTIERTAEKRLGFEKFTITGDLFEPMHWDIGFEKKVSKKITFIYGTGFESWEMRRIGINYSINNNLSIFTLHDQENMNSSVDLNFNLKIK